jgi:hypothetical protein
MAYEDDDDLFDEEFDFGDEDEAADADSDVDAEDDPPPPSRDGAPPARTNRRPEAPRAGHPIGRRPPEGSAETAATRNDRAGMRNRSRSPRQNRFPTTTNTRSPGN